MNVETWAGASLRRHAHGLGRPDPTRHGLPRHGLTRRGLLAASLASLVLAACRRAPLVIGRPGVERGGAFRHPRAVAVSEHGLAVLDRTGRLQILDLDGNFVRQFAVAPEGSRRGLPVGVTWLPDGALAVADTHQSRVRVYDPSGATLRTIGGYGLLPGQFLAPQRVVPTRSGGLLVSDHGLGKTNRVQVLDHEGNAVLVMGGPDPVDGGLIRPMGVLETDDGYLVADQRAGLVLFDSGGELAGPPRGWPAAWDGMTYGLTRDDEGALYVSDLKAHRIVRLDSQGTPTGTFGGQGREPGRFVDPWDVQWHAGHLYVADCGNHRVQRIDAKRAGWTNP